MITLQKIVTSILLADSLSLPLLPSPSSSSLPRLLNNLVNLGVTHSLVELSDETQPLVTP